MRIRQDAARPRGFPRDPGLVFAITILLASLLLQRFAVPFGGFPLGIVGPVGLAIAGVALLRGTLAFDRARLGLFLLFLGLVLAGAAANAAMGPRFGVGPSWPSLIHFVALTSFATLTFVQPLEETRLFRAVVTCLAAVAAAAVVQFVLQFAGLAFFTFREIVPDPFLLELLYNTRIPIGETDFFKANGLVLLEPSILSQFMALGIIIELLWFRRPAMVALFLAALLLSVSGTGWLVLGAFLAGAVLGMGRRGVALAGVMLLLLGTGLALLSVVMPDAYVAFVGRADEISMMDSSAHQRFITPFWALQDVMDRVPWTLAFGVGAGVGERLPLAYNYFLNTPVKLIIEFGLPVAITYVALFTVSVRTRRQAMLVAPGLVMLLLAGPYQQLAPVLFPVLLIMTIARLVPEAAPRAAAASPFPTPLFATGANR